MAQGREYHKSYYEANREARLSAAKIYYAENKEKISKKTAEYKRNNRIKVNAWNKASAMKRRNEAPELFREKRRRAALASYGLSESDYSNMLAVQNGACAICAAHHSECGRLVVDHDHQTGSVRGLLCHKCNLAIGLLDEDVERVGMASAYLKKFMEVQHGVSAN